LLHLRLDSVDDFKTSQWVIILRNSLLGTESAAGVQQDWRITSLYIADSRPTRLIKCNSHFYIFSKWPAVWNTNPNMNENVNEEPQQNVE
jgi:hypothetical protein